MPSARDASSPARYAFTDRSLARPALTRLCFAPLFRLVPRWLAANFVTLLSFSCLVLALVLALVPGLPPALLALALVTCQTIYVAGDHLDGMQAVASGTTSPLGDFLDHYCDLWGGAILSFAFWALVGPAPAPLLYAIEGLLILGFAVTYVEREEQRSLHFTTLGALEANCLLAAFLLSWIPGGVRAWWQEPLAATLPRWTLPLALAAAMAVGVLVVIVARMRRVPLTVVVFAASLGALGWLAARAAAAPLEGWLLLALLGADYVGRVMRGYLRAGSRSRPDAAATLAIAGLCAWALLAGPAPAALGLGLRALGLWLLVRAAWSLVDILRSLRQHWVWTNRTRALQEA